MVIQLVSKRLPYVCRSLTSCDVMSVSAVGLLNTMLPAWAWDLTASTCSLPPAFRSCLSYGTSRYTKLFGWRACGFWTPERPPTSSTIHRFPNESAWMPSYPPRPNTPDTSSTWDGKSSVACQTPPALPFSAVNSSRCAQGYQVEPSKVGSALPVTSFVAMRVTRWAMSASRLIRVMLPGPDS